jgi:hypothetical protein
MQIPQSVFHEALKRQWQIFCLYWVIAQIQINGTEGVLMLLHLDPKRTEKLRVDFWEKDEIDFLLIDLRLYN